MAQGFDTSRNTFRAAYGSQQLDASLLLLAQTGFVKPDDPRFIGTVEAIERDLVREGFVMRYNTHGVDDGLRPGEGAFLACSFWLCDAYISIGRRADANKLFSRLLAIRNELGLLAEEYEPREQRHQGNFPQAFSHIALINTAFNLTRIDKPSTQRADGDSGLQQDDVKRPEASSASR
jgi:GH15 family glucan-1,4-alpha-glucosidase